MRSVLLILTLFFATTYSSSSLRAQSLMPWKAFSQARCSGEFQKFADKEMWLNDKFSIQVPESYNKQTFRNQSKTIGVWVEIIFSEKESPIIVKINDDRFQSTGFDKNCQPEILDTKWPWHLSDVFESKNNNNWNNKNLKKIIASGKKGVIYNWSPRFAYSVGDLPRIEKLARRLGYEFTAVVDPRATQSEVTGALGSLAKKHKTFERNLASAESYHRNVSSDLFMRNGFNHFPVIYVYGENKIHPRWVTGVMTDNGLKEMLSTYSAELK